MDGTNDGLKERLMRTDIEEIEEKLRSGYYRETAKETAEEVLAYKKQHPDVLSDEKPVSKRTRRIAFIVTIGLVSALYFGLKGTRKVLSQNNG